METLTTPRLTVRPVTTDDAGFVLELLNEPGFLTNVGDRGLRTLTDAWGYIATAPLFDRSGGLGYGVAVERAGGEPCGLCGLARRDWLDDPDVGYAFIQRFEGRGYATEAAGAALAYGLGRLRLPRVVAITTPDNLASRRVLEKIGMRLEGRVRPPGQDRETCLYVTG